MIGIEDNEGQMEGIMEEAFWAVVLILIWAWDSKDSSEENIG